MATLADMKARIVAELMRDDLDSGGDLESHMVSTIGRACEYYADRRFWFNAIVTTVDTVGGTATVAIPATVRRVDRVTIPAHNVELTEAILGEVDDIDSVTQGRPGGTPITTIPCAYSVFQMPFTRCASMVWRRSQRLRLGRIPASGRTRRRI